MAKFQVYKDAAGKCRFRLRADNNRIIAVGEAYDKHAGCINGIKSIQRNCNSAIEDTTVEGAKKLPNPKYEVYRDAANKYRFRLKAGNGQIIAESEGYETKDACLDGIEAVKSSCPKAEIDDSTIAIKPIEVSESTIPETKETAPNIIVPTEPAATSDLTISSQITAAKVDQPIIEEKKTEPVTIAAEPTMEPSKRDEMIEQLKKIRASVEKPPAPTPPKGLWNEYKAFLRKFGIVGVAIALVIGIYLGILVKALVADLLMPAIGLVIPNMTSLTEISYTFMNQTFTIGDFLVALITFLIVLVVVFIAVKIAKKWKIE